MQITAPRLLDRVPADKRKEFEGKLTSALTASCKEDKWPADGMKCVTAATDDKSMDKCDDLMKPIDDKLMVRLRPILEEMEKLDTGAKVGEEETPDPVEPDPTAKPVEPSGGGGGDADVEKFIADYAALKDKLCACADKACADKVKAEADAHERSAKDKNLRKPTPEEEERFEKIEDEVNACAAKLSK
jgi:hypothetical protein